MNLFNNNELKLEKQKLENDIINLNNEKGNLEKQRDDLARLIENLSDEVKGLEIKKKEISNQLIRRENFFLETEMKYIDTLSGLEFETYCCDLLKKLGYEAAVTKATQDDGGDIVASKDNESYIIQCKNYSGSVGNKAIQEVYAAKGIYNCDNAIVVTNNYFTEQAKKEASILKIVLWDRGYLASLLISSYNFYINTLDDIKNSQCYMDNNKTDKELTEELLDDEDETDPFLMEAIQFVVETGQASTSVIQRRFKVGYARAERIIDQLEERGVVSAYQGSRPRKVLMTLDEWNKIKNGEV